MKQQHMKKIKVLLYTFPICVIAMLWCCYVYIGTYVFPIAPYWVTQLPPNPPSPHKKHGEFAFELQYSIKGQRKTIEDILVCDFEGYEVRELFGSKKRTYSEYYKNEQGHERFPNSTGIVLYKQDTYVIVLDVSPANYFLGDPEYIGKPELPDIQVYDTRTGYYKYPDEKEEIFEKLDFIIINWSCDKPIENNF